MKTAMQQQILFSGYAKLPTGITASEISSVVGVMAVIDVEKGIIIEADCTLATELARRHVAEAIGGYSLQDGIEPLVQVIERIYQGNAKRAIITALRIIHDKYRSFLEDQFAALEVPVLPVK